MMKSFNETTSPPSIMLQNMTSPIHNAFQGRQSNNSNNNSSKSSSALNSAMAGYVAGFSGTIVGYPLDSAKVWIQTGGCKNKHMIMASSASAASASSKRLFSTETAAASSSCLWRSSGNACTRVAQGVRAIYSGVSAPLLTVGLVQSLNFAVYDTTRQVLHQRRMTHEDMFSTSSSSSYLTNDALSGVATAGFVSGMTIAFLTAPLIMIKTNQQITGNSFREALRDSLYKNGRLCLTCTCAAGFLPHVIGESVGRAIYYVTYEGLKRSWSSLKATNESSTAISLQERMVCAAMSGIACWAVIFPLDSLRSRVYGAAAAAKQQQSSSSSSSARSLLSDTMRQMHQERSFYRGFWVTVLRAGPVAAAVLPVYDLTLEALSSFN